VKSKTVAVLHVIIMKVTHYIPEHPLLKPLIAEIYLLERDPHEPAEKYLAFPGIHQFVTMNRSAAYDISNQRVSVIHQQGGTPSGLLVTNFNRPHIWYYKGEIQEWNICFKPLAINYFVDIKPGFLSEINIISEFNYFDDFKHHSENLYQLADAGEQVCLIENYWLSKLRSFKHPFLPVLLDKMLENNDRRLNYGEWAAHFRVSRDTLHTAFKRYVGTSPARFEKIFRFRLALSAYRLTHQYSTLTGVSGEAAYFDQSHMIRDFRALTGYTPKEFYKKVASFPKGEINWIFE